jgi:FADH2 O2-dependent halogenase
VTTQASGGPLLATGQRLDVDVAVIGSGFSGSLAAAALHKLDRRVALVEQGTHPRFAIGESSTPLASLLLEELADRYDLPRVRPFSKWGTWQRARAEVACGLKRGFTFFFHRPGEAFGEDPERERQLLVAASPRDELGDTHWYRPDFDHALVREAEAQGVLYLDETRLDRFAEEGSGIVLEGSRRGRHLRIRAGFVIDASGPRGFLHRMLGLEDARLTWLPPTHGIYTHFEHVERWDRLAPTAEQPPYPVDDAALHHVFPGGWIWILRFGNGITSAGAALTEPVASAVHAGEGQGAWERLLAALPSVGAQFAGATARRPFVHVPRLAFRSGVVHGARWALLPSAVGIIDPLLSTGFPLTLLGVGRLLDVLARTADGPERMAGLEAYAKVTQNELDATERLVAALYANMSDPRLFKRLALLYFAAASYSEAARRLGRPHMVQGFLLHAHPVFGPELCAVTDLAIARPQGPHRDALCDRIDRAIEPFDTAGLLDRSRKDWYPVLADDLLASASKLHVTADEISLLLERLSWPTGSRRASPAVRQ